MFFKKRNDTKQERVSVDWGYFNSEEYRRLQRIQHTYYDHVKKVQEAWSVLYNLDAYNTKRGDQFEKMCIENVRLHQEMRMAEEGTPVELERDLSVPGYTRLAMLYEKRGEYDKAIEVCADSIRARWVKGEYARLARMIKKSKKPVDDNIMALLDQGEES